MIKLQRLLLAVVFLLAGFLFVGRVLAEDCNANCNSDDECTAKINECNKRLSLSIAATKPHELRMEELQTTIDTIDQTVQTLTQLIAKKKELIGVQEQKLGSQQSAFEVKVRSFYENRYYYGTGYLLSLILSRDNTGDKVRNMAYRESLINRDKQAITALVLQIVDLNNSKKQLQENQDQLASQKAALEVTLAPIRKLVEEARAYQKQLSNTVSGLSARQQELLAEKTGNFSTSVGDVPPADDPASRPDYNPGFSPAFAGFSFGAPHRKGMSQYGAFGRAKSGQSAEDILHGYYGGGIEIKKDYSTGITISVQGYGSYNIEDYVKRIYEVPNSWGDEGGYEALKAQAVAARSYALAYTNNGSGSICATEACQVFQSGAKGGNWDRAVNETRGWVLVANGHPFSAWYAASSGGYDYPYSANGYTTSGGWDTKCGNQGCWTPDAYEKIAGSPWFYKAWYRPRFGSASRSSPWLKNDEFADIVNAILLYQRDSGTISHLSQTDKSNSDTWSRDRVRSELSNRGGSPIDSVDSISVSYSTGGYTNTVVVNGITIDGGAFRQIFNIRAPGEIWLASALFNLVRK